MIDTFGELAFEHYEHYEHYENPPRLWRVVSRRTRGERTLDVVCWFDDKEAADALCASAGAKGECFVIAEYRIADRGD